MDRLEKFSATVTGLLKWLAGISLVAMMALTCLDVILRALGRPLTGAVEVEACLGTLCLAFALPQTQARCGQVGVEVLTRRMPQRTVEVLGLITGLASLGLCLVIAWQSWVYAGHLAAGGHTTATLEMPAHIMVRAMSVGFCGLCLVLVAQAAGSAAKVLRS